LPKFRADFDVKTTVVLPDGSAPLVLRGNDPVFEIIIRNAKPDSSGYVPSLDVQVITTSESIDMVPDAFRSLLAQQLDILTFVMHSTFLIKQCRRVMEWEPYQKSREFRALQKFDPLYPPDPELRAECIDTAQAISQAQPEGYVQRALRCFRYGVLSWQLEEQFQQFWLAIETIAEGSKEATKIPITCQKCQGSLTCENCNDTPMRRPMAQQAIKNLVGKIVKVGSEEMYRSLLNARNHLMHGRSSESIEAKIGRPLADLVNDVGFISWHAIMLSMPKIERPLHISHRGGNFANGELIAGPRGVFAHEGEGEHPTEDKIPNVKIDLMIHFKKP
jgi:hypothetical protein